MRRSATFAANAGGQMMPRWCLVHTDGAVKLRSTGELDQQDDAADQPAGEQCGAGGTKRNTHVSGETWVLCLKQRQRAGLVRASLEIEASTDLQLPSIAIPFDRAEER